MKSSIIIILICYVELYFQQEVRQHLSVCSTEEIYVPMAVLLPIDGILHLMAQNIQNQRLEKELFTLYQSPAIPIITAILKVTVT